MSALIAIRDLKNRIEDLSQWAMYKEGTSKIHMDGFIKEVSEIEKSAAAELLALRAELADAKARAKTAEENWHKNEARIGKLQSALYDLFQSCSDLPFTEMNRMEKEINAASFALKGAA